MKTTSLFQRSKRTDPTYFLISAVLMSLIVNARAQLSWGVNGAGGNGTWDSVTPNWSDGTNNVAWANDGAAVFGGTGGIVSINGPVRASAVTFGVPGYVLTGELGGAPGGLTIRADADAAIGSIYGPIESAILLTKTGPASLTVAKWSSGIGQVVVEDGELIFGGSFSSLSLANSGDAIFTFGYLSVGNLSGGGIVRAATGAASGNISIGNSGNFRGSLRDNGSSLVALTKYGAGVQQLTGVNTYSGSTMINQGTLALSEGGSARDTAITLTGGTLLLDNTTIANGNRVSDTAPINLVSGSIVMEGHSLVPAAETLGDLVLGNRAASISVKPTVSQPAALTFASFGARESGHLGIVTFSGPSLGQTPGPGVASILFASKPALVGGSVLHPEAAILPGALGNGASGATFVTYGPNGIRPLDDAEYARDTGSFSSWENADIGTARWIVPGSTINALRLRNGAAIASSGSLAVQSGVILTQPGNATITVDTLDFGSREILLINDGNLTITGRITASDPSSRLTKTGAGRLTLAGANSLSGPIDILQGSLYLKGSTAPSLAGRAINVQSGAAIELAGGVSLAGTVVSTGGVLRSLDGENRIANVRSSSSNVDVASGGLTVAGIFETNSLFKTGNGTLTVAGSMNISGSIRVRQGMIRLQNSTATTATTATLYVENGAAVELVGGSFYLPYVSISGSDPNPRTGLRSVGGDNRIGDLYVSSTVDIPTGSLTAARVSTSGSTGMIKTGAGTLTITNSVSGPVVLNGGTLRFSPEASNPAAAFAFWFPGTFTFKGGASTLAVDRGAKASVTVTFSSPFIKTSPATLLIAPAGGFAALGLTEKIKLNSSSDTAFPMVNEIVPAWIMGQDNDANRSGDFLSYTAATGLKRATFSTSTNLRTAGSTAIFNATTPQTFTSNASVFALKNSGQTIDLAGRILTLGTPSLGGEGVIFNGGSILGGTLRFAGSTRPVIYTSLAGGTIDSAVEKPGYGSSIPVIKTGPGKLTLSGGIGSSIYVESGTLHLEGGGVSQNIILARGTTVSGTGGVGGSITGGLISPGNGIGILTAATTGSSEDTVESFVSYGVTTAVSLAESFAPTSFAFEFTRTGAPIFNKHDASGNDLLRLTTGRVRGFSSALTAADEVSIYLALADHNLQSGDILRGGFFTDRNASFLDLIDDATFRYFLRDDGGGTIFNGLAYTERTDLPIEIATVPQTANFGSGNVNGTIMEVRIVPEPSVLTLLLAAALAPVRRERARR